jgi:hypothetical protein
MPTPPTPPASPTTSAWHWEKAVKYAVEGIKTALLLNGVAAIALMTFANTHTLSVWGIAALLVFAFGAMLSAIAFFCAYRTEQGYGNALYPEADQVDVWKKAQLWNAYTVITLLLSVSMFAGGAVMGAFALANQVAGK